MSNPPLGVLRERVPPPARHQEPVLAVVVPVPVPAPVPVHNEEADLERSVRRLHGLPSQLLRFAAVGVVSTLGYLLLYAALRPAAGPQAANALALPACAIANTAANRRLTFGVRGRAGAARHHVRGLVAFLIGLALTSGALAALHHVAPGAGHRAETGALVAANLAATLLRFLLLRSWVFPGRHASRTEAGSR